MRRRHVAVRAPAEAARELAVVSGREQTQTAEWGTSTIKCRPQGRANAEALKYWVRRTRGQAAFAVIGSPPEPNVRGSRDPRRDFDVTKVKIGSNADAHQGRRTKATNPERTIVAERSADLKRDPGTGPSFFRLCYCGRKA